MLIQIAWKALYVWVCACVRACMHACMRVQYTNARGVFHHRVDFHHRCVVFDKKVVEFDHVLGRFVHQSLWETHFLSNLEEDSDVCAWHHGSYDMSVLFLNLSSFPLPHLYGLIHLDALYDVDGLFHDGVWILSCHVLYVHAPLRAANQHRALSRDHHHHYHH